MPPATFLWVAKFPLCVLLHLVIHSAFSPQKSCGFREFLLLGVRHLPVRHFDRIRTGGISLRRRQSQGLGDGIFLGFLDFPNFFAAFARIAFVVCLIGIGTLRISFCVPCQIATLGPSADWRFDAVTEVVFAMGGGGDLVPAEVDSAARALLPDRREQVHTRM